jgi:aminoglycoside phosphotransferase (APT) family kinase protein
MAVEFEQLDRIAQGREAEIFAWEGGRALRLFRTARSAASLESEVAAMRAARSVLPLVPEVFEVVEVSGRSGFVMERVDGPDLITLLGSKPWQVWSAGSTLGRLHAQLHASSAPAELDALHTRLRRVFAQEKVSVETARRLNELLDALPNVDGLCHGDFHPGNVLMSGNGPVVIDWPNATSGDPAADFARTDLLLRMGDPPPGTPAVVTYLQGFGRKLIRSAYRRAYLKARPTDPDLVDRWQLVRVGDRLFADDIAVEHERLKALLREGGVPT